MTNTELTPGEVTEDDLAEERWLAVTVETPFDENTQFWLTGQVGNRTEPNFTRQFHADGRNIGIENFDNALDELNEGIGGVSATAIEEVDESEVPVAVLEEVED